MKIIPTVIVGMTVLSTSLFANLDPISVWIQLQSIRCIDEDDGLSGAAEPYLWTVFFKIDGDTAVVDGNLALQGTATVLGTPGNHGNLLNRDVDSGETVHIPPQLGEFQTVLRPLSDTFGASPKFPGTSDVSSSFSKKTIPPTLLPRRGMTLSTAQFKPP